MPEDSFKVKIGRRLKVEAGEGNAEEQRFESKMFEVPFFFLHFNLSHFSLSLLACSVLGAEASVSPLFSNNITFRTRGTVGSKQFTVDSFHWEFRFEYFGLLSSFSLID
jgi:hypothetical protein